MLRIAYLFERFPSFGQTFCYREVVELKRQGADVSVFSIRRPTDEPAQDWDADLVGNVCYLPDEAELVKEVDRQIRLAQLPDAAVRAIKEWDRRTDFLRLYQAAYVGLRLQQAGIHRLHAHFAGMAARTAYWIKKFFGIEFSLTAHANDIFAPRDFAISLSHIFDAATFTVTVSDFAMAQLMHKYPEAYGTTCRIYNGIDLDEFIPADFAGEVPLIISVGRLIDKKGFPYLIGACAVLKEVGHPFRCEIIGEGPLREGLLREIKQLKLEDCVHLVGPKTQREIVKRLAAANVFVLPCIADASGDMDNLPTVIMEAMAASLPVVSTAIAGIPEMIEPGKSGELVLPKDFVNLSRAIHSFLRDPVRARQFGMRGRELAAEKFSLTKNVRALHSVLPGLQ